ncbi:hypothetical protein B4U84_28115 [Westiellopsis prolifica IICB1]|nr:hypothetical protein B4U84_28115 [Westiellopsis prolifica IICB1]
MQSLDTCSDWVKDWENSVAILHYHNSQRFDKYLNIRCDKREGSPEEYINKYSFFDEDTNARYVARCFEIIDNNENNLELFQQISNEAEGVPISEIWKIFFEVDQVEAILLNK